ncbi:MAG: hypothetical protein Q9164_001616 [Protoblastenia rupestris]
MISVTLLFLTLVAVSAAQNTTVSLLLPLADPQSLVGSIVGADATATTYVVQCVNTPPRRTSVMEKRQARATASARGSVGNSDEDAECGFPLPVTIAQGPSTLNMTVNFAEEIGQTLNCDLQGTTQAVCTATVSVYNDNEGATSTLTETLSGTDYPTPLPILITAGADKIKGASAQITGSTTGSSTASTGSSPSSTGGSPTSATSTGGDSTSSGTAASSTGSGSGGIQVEPTFGVAIAGVVAMGVAAIML